MPILSNPQLSLMDPVFIDGFAGGGGWSTGFEQATGWPITIAINHNPDAVRMHKCNHPFTTHYCENIYEVEPEQAVNGNYVKWAHFSPDCTFFSKARGGKPAEKSFREKKRSLAWVVLKWAAKTKPDIISLENVEEFQKWGPLKKGKAIKSKAGQTFNKWKSQLEALGYEVEHKELIACDYGAPTSRKRLFVIARRDGKPIVWPEPTHGNPESEAVKSGKLLPWKTAAGIIDWTLPCPSIFATKKEIKEQFGFNAKRPLAENTMQRIIRGLETFFIKSNNPYILTTCTEDKKHTSTTTPNIVQVNHSGGFRGQNIAEPLQTITGKHGYGVTTPVFTPINVLSSKIAPSIIQYHTEQSGSVRGQSVTVPVKTIDTSNRHGYVGVSLTKYHGNDAHGQNIKEPAHTITSKDRLGLITASMVHFYGASKEYSVNTPVPTSMSNNHEALTLAYLSKYHSQQDVNHIGTPEQNIESASHIVKFKGKNIGQKSDMPLQTVTASGQHFGAVITSIIKVDATIDLHNWPAIRELLNKYCGYSLGPNDLKIFCFNNEWYFISDIGLRMLTPRELYNANGFPPDYIIDRDNKGNTFSKSKQVDFCGNSVPPPFTIALVRANMPEYCIKEPAPTMEVLNSLVAI